MNSVNPNEAQSAAPHRVRPPKILGTDRRRLSLLAAAMGLRRRLGARAFHEAINRELPFMRALDPTEARALWLARQARSRYDPALCTGRGAAARRRRALDRQRHSRIEAAFTNVTARIVEPMSVDAQPGGGVGSGGAIVSAPVD